MKRLGIFGGTFDPIHSGHLIIAQEIRIQCHLDRVLFIPSARPPHKHHTPLIAPEHRYAMAVLATQDDPWFEVSDIELKRPGLSYSAETLQALHRMYGPACELFFLIGADRLVHIDTWRSREEIFERAQVVVVPRSGVDMDHTPAARRQRVICLPSPRTDISSTNIRRCVQTGHSIRNLVPSSVEAYIRENRLYMT